MVSFLITFEEFSKVEMKVGKVVKAERVTGTINLVRMVVDFGDTEKQVIAGIARWYMPEMLINRHFVFVTNLKPRFIMGYKSEAMILAAEDEKGDVYLVTTDGNPSPGAKVH